MPRPWRGIRGHLLALVVVAAVPALVLSLLAAWVVVERYRSAAEGRLLDTARALALALDSEIDSHVAALTTLAANPGLLAEGGVRADAALQAGVAARHLGSGILLRGPGPDYLLRFATWQPPNAPRPVDRLPTRQTSAVARLFATGQPVVGRMAELPEHPGLAAPVYVPVRNGSEVVATLGALLTPERLSQVLVAQGLGSGITATLTDRSGTIAARSADIASMVGLSRPDNPAVNQAGPGAIWGRRLPDGGDIRIGYAPLHRAEGWTLWVSQDRTQFEAAWREPAITISLAITLMLALASALAIAVARRIAVPVTLLARRAEATAASEGEALPPSLVPPSGVQELERLRLALEAAEGTLRRRVQAEQQAAAALRESEARFRAMADNIPQLAWMARPDGWIFWYNRRWYDYTGTTLQDMQGWGWRRVHHPEHLDRVEAHFRAQVAAGESWEDTFPLRARDGGWRWFLSRAQPIRDAAGRVVLWFGTNTDVTDRMAAEEHRLMLAKEVDHRAKNVLAVVQALLALTPAEEGSARRFATAVGGRVAAMARAHALLARERWVGAEMLALVREELAPFAEGVEGRVVLAGPELRLPPELAQPLSLVLHELATNAAKYGALSAATGRLSVTWALPQPGLLRLDWQERGGPPLPEEPHRAGFGSRLIARTVRHQLGGQARLEWRQEGLAATLTVVLPVAEPAAGDHAA